MISRVKDATNSQVCSKMQSQSTLFSSPKNKWGLDIQDGIGQTQK